MTVLKYQKIKNLLIKDIRSGILKPGDKLPKRDELIEQFGVTRTTLNRALSELSDEGFIHAIRRSGTFISEKSPIIKLAVVVKDDEHIVHNHIDEPSNTQSIYSSFFNAPENLKVTFIQNHNFSIQNCLNLYDRIIWILPSEKELDIIKKFDEHIIVVNRDPEWSNFISTNHYQGIKDTTTYFLKKTSAKCKIFFFDSLNVDFVFRERKRGFVDACEEFGVFYRFLNSGNNFESKLDSLNKEINFKGDKTIIISPSMSNTGAMLNFAVSKKMKMGRDFYYADFDNFISEEIYGFQVPTILQDYKGIADKLIQNIIDDSQKKYQEYIPYKMVGFEK